MSDDVDPIDELVARILRDHVLLELGRCSCGWGHMPSHLGRLHSLHVVAELRRVGALRTTRNDQ